MAEVVWSHDAIADLQIVISYVEQFNPAAAERLALRLLNAAESLSEFPNRGILSTGGYHVLATVRPYNLLYDTDGTSVVILSVHHAARPPRW